MSFLSTLPETEQEFAKRTALGFLSETDTLKDLLGKIVSFQGELAYGWGEAVLGRKWYRWPSELETMRFCSEAALKNFIICKALALPVKYYVCEDYYGTGSSHEFVVQDCGGYDFLIDWKLLKGRLSDRNFWIKGGGKIPLGKIAEIPEDMIIDRVNKLRSAQSFLDAVVSGQFLLCKYSNFGYLEVSVKYFPVENCMEFRFVYFPYSGRLNFYYLQRYRAGGEIEDEVGFLADKCGKNSKAFPVAHGLFEFAEMINGKRIDIMLPERLLRSILIHVIRETGHVGSLATSEGTRKNAMDKFKRIIRGSRSNKRFEASEFIVDFYDKIHQLCGFDGAERFLDGIIFRNSMDSKFRNFWDLVKLANRFLSMSVSEIIMESIAICFYDIAGVLSILDCAQFQKTICEAMVQESGIRSFNFKEPKIYNILRFAKQAYAK
jgi:hypothetical protein